MRSRLRSRRTHDKDLAILLLLLSCQREVSEELLPIPPPPEEVAADAFDPLPDPTLLLPQPGALRQTLDDEGLSPEIASIAAGSSYKTGVFVKNLAAARTGAEIANLLLEAGEASPEVTRARLQRIQAGLESFTEPPLSAQLLDGLSERSDEELHGDPWVSALQRRHSGVSETLIAHKDHPQLPLVLAGGWLQASWLTALALERSGRAEVGHALLYQPEISDYFLNYVHTRGKQDFPQGVLDSLESTLDVMRDRTSRDPMTPEDVAAVRRAVEGLLSSM